VLDPFAVDSDGDPAPLNIPASSEATTVTVPLWRVNTSLILQYVAERQRTERIIFMLQSDLQPVVVDPTLAQDSETITKSGADVGVPIIHLLNSTTVRGTVVSVGQIIFPDNPALPGGRAAQRCTVGGLTGTSEPVFSDVVGTVTVDGAAHWASLGTTSPTENATDWTAVSNVPEGAMILPRRPFFIPWTTFIQPALVKVGQSGVSASIGTIVQASNGSYQVCTEGGITSRGEPGFSTTWGDVVNSGASQWTSLGMTLPSGTTYFVAVQGGVTGDQYVIPPFNDAQDATTGDGSVIWQSVGTGDIPVGGVPGNVTASQYFSTDRGRQSIEYLASILRSHLLWSARCVTITFDCDWLRGSQLSTRMTATLHDPRIAGGIALGKIKTVEMVMDQTGAAICHVTIACCVGKGTAITEVPGDAEYVDDDYVEDEYQVHDGVVTLVPNLSDMAYAPPVTSATDDGLTFPLTLSQILVSDQVRGTVAAQTVGINSALASMAKAAQITQFPPSSLDDSVRQQRQAELARANSVPFQLQQNPIWQDWVIKPVNAGPFNAVYNVKFAQLVVPMDIDLLSETTT
jgi:hypothetical protein